MADDGVLFEALDFIGPVTSLSFNGDFIISGEGPYIRIYNSVSGALLTQENVLPRCRIHTISVESRKRSIAAVCGQKAIRVVSLSSHSSSFSLSAVTDVTFFPDLIWCMQWIYDGSDDPESVAIATAHNAVWIWHWPSGVRENVAQCEEQSILYSARFFGQSLEELLLASGTVFNQVLVWNVKGQRNKDGKTEVLHRLTGHEGVIFSVDFNKGGSLIASVSDDRSIRLWKVTGSLGQTDSKVDPLLVMFGHTARLWDVKLLDDCIVSIGEDSTCCVWSYEGQIKKKFKGHKGRSIWSLAINNQEDTIATGGGDSSIRLWPLGDEVNQQRLTVEAALPVLTVQENLEYHENSSSVEQKKDFPRSVVLLSLHEMLVMTNKGCLYKYSWHRNDSPSVAESARSGTKTNQYNNTASSNWALLLSDPNFTSYAVMSLSPCKQLVAFGNLQGSVKLCLVGTWWSVQVQPYSGKVLSLVWTTVDSPHNLISCGPEGRMDWWKVTIGLPAREFHLEPLRTFWLPPSKQRWATCAELLILSRKNKVDDGKGADPYLLLCGDRKGSLHLYDPRQNCDKDQRVKPSHSLRGVHGRIGVSQICVRDEHVFTAGRDGFYRQCRLREDVTLEVIDKKKVYKGLEWVEKLVFAPNGDLLVAGFHTAFFVLWSVGRNELLLKVKCGGGHRAWDFTLHQNSHVTEAVFTFLKGQQLFAEHVTMRSAIATPVLKPGFHGREATCICRLGPVWNNKDEIIEILATGSEDTDINLLAYNSTSGCITRVFTAQGHISSVRALAACACGILRTHRQPTTKRDYEMNRAVEYNQTNPYDCEASSGVGTSSDCSSKYLLFSGGGRASLKCWRIDHALSATNLPTNSCHVNCVTSSPMVLLAEYATRSSKYRRRRKLEDKMHSEIRFMSLSAVNLGKFTDDSFMDTNIDSCQSLYCVVAACSDGFVRLYGFDEALREFIILAQSEYLKRCVLSVQCVIHHDPGNRAHLVLFAGDTAGKVTVWDVTQHVLEYIKETCEMNAEGEEDVTSRVENDMKGKPRDCLRRDEYIFANCVDDTLNKIHLHKLRLNENKGVSCVPLVQNMLGLPLYVFTAHQSGVNDISVSAFEEDATRYVLVSGGDDGALFLVDFQLTASYSDKTKQFVLTLEKIKETCVPSAHTSSVTGVKVFHNGQLLSSSVDQRLKLWAIDRKQKSGKTNHSVQCVGCKFVDVPDVQDIEAWQDSRDDVRIAVCGVGLQTFKLTLAGENS